MTFTPFTPKHRPNRQYELCWHPVCTHVTWRHRKTPLPLDLPEEYIPVAPRNLPLGSPFCPACAQAQQSPDPSTPRLILSLAPKRITAIGFLRDRKDELKALHFQWGRVVGVWVYLPDNTSTLEATLPRLADSLKCATEVADVRWAPSLPAQDIPDVSAPTSGSHVPQWAVIACPRPGGSYSQNEQQQKAFPIIATIDWPPQLQTIRAAATAGPPPEVPRILMLPSLSDLIELGFTQTTLWHLASELTTNDIALDMQGDKLGLDIQLGAIRQLRADVVGLCTPSPQAPEASHSIAAADQPQAPKAPHVAAPDTPPITVSRVLVLPTLPELIRLGFTHEDLFRLALDLTPLDVVLRTEDGLIDLAKPLSAVRQLPRGSRMAAPSVPAQPKPKGGRPATARARVSEVLRLHQDRLSAAAIARQLGISDRSVRRLLPPGPNERPPE